MIITSIAGLEAGRRKSCHSGVEYPRSELPRHLKFVIRTAVHIFIGVKKANIENSRIGLQKKKSVEEAQKKNAEAQGHTAG
jgi:hypothetical protein